MGRSLARLCLAVAAIVGVTFPLLCASATKDGFAPQMTTAITWNGMVQSM